MKNEIFIRALTSKWLIIFAFVINFFIHLPFMNTPPHSVHTWRQCNTLAVARNFYTEEMNIFETRVDNRFETDGITGSHFPLYEYILALFYKIFGEQFWVHRYFSLLIFYAGAIGLYKLLKQIFRIKLPAIIASFSYLFAPMLFYYQITALPDTCFDIIHLGFLFIYYLV